MKLGNFTMVDKQLHIVIDIHSSLIGNVYTVMRICDFRITTVTPKNLSPYSEPVRQPLGKHLTPYDKYKQPTYTIENMRKNDRHLIEYLEAKTGATFNGLTMDDVYTFIELLDERFNTMNKPK